MACRAGLSKCAALALLALASFPGPSRRGGERAWYTLHVHAPGGPRKMWGNRILSYTLRLSSIELYVMQNLRTITMVMRPVTMETPAHARVVCTRPFLFLFLKGLGTRLRLLELENASLWPLGPSWQPCLCTRHNNSDQS